MPDDPTLPLLPGDGASAGPPRHLRGDPARGAAKGYDPLGPARSGQTLVIGAIIVLAVLWTILWFVFQRWRAQYRELADFGRREVATAVDPLADITPPGVPPTEWRKDVADTHALLVALTASGLLDRPRLDALRAELRERVARTTPETAVAELTSLWDDLQARAGPILMRPTQRPPFVPERPARLRKK